MKRTKLDIVFSDLVRCRPNWTCETCHKFYPEGHRQGLHCSHIFGRRAVSTRHHPSNAICQCYRCHKKGEEDRKWFCDFVTEHMGRGAFERLHQVWHKPVKWPKHVREDIYQHYKSELKRMQTERNDGYLGRIDFEKHEVMEEI